MTGMPAMTLMDLSRLLAEPPEQLCAPNSSKGLESALRQAAQVGPSDVRAILEARGFVFSPRVLAFMNLKGGVGKTTSVLSMASRAVQYGWKTDGLTTKYAKYANIRREARTVDRLEKSDDRNGSPRRRRRTRSGKENRELILRTS